MSNPNYAPRTSVAIEGLERRTMFDATPGPSFASVLSHVQETAASQLRLSEHAAQSSAELAAAKQSAANVAAAGKALLAADKAAVKAANDADGLAAAKQKLGLDSALVKADTLAAKANVKSLQAQAKAAGASLKAAIKEDRALLNAQLKDADGPARKAVSKLLKDWQLVQAGSTLTSGDLQALADDLKAAADGATQPSAASIDTLRANAIVAMVDGNLSDVESESLLGDLKNVFLSAGIADAQAQEITDDVAVIMEKLSVDDQELATLLSDVQLTLAAFSAA